MPIVNLRKRHTSDFDEFSKYEKSSDSLVFSNGEMKLDDSGPDCMTLSAGECWYDKGRYVAIDPDKGIKVRPHEGVVIETLEHIALPLNIYGLIFGAGSNIYKGAFVSNGKIDPGYNGKLRIGYHNASNDVMTIRTGDKLAYVLFVTSETNLDNASKALKIQAPEISILTKKEKVLSWLKKNWYNSAAIIIALASLLNSLLT